MEHHTIGEKICLWHVFKINADVFVIREVVATICEVVYNPYLPQSLTAIDHTTGALYVKTLDVMRVHRGSYQLHTWCQREDGELPRKIWSPIEAVAVYNAVISTFEGGPTDYRLLRYKSHEDMIPKGDVSYCEEHDQYMHGKNECIMCATSLERA